RGRQLGAALWIALGTFIKLFPLAGVTLALFHPRRWRFAVILAGLAVALAALPLVVVSPDVLAAQYRSWRAIEAADTLNRGYSLMQYLYMWFGADWPHWPVQLAGTALLVAPLRLGPPRRVHAVEIVPRWVKSEILIPYRIKGVPCVVAWFAIQAELFATALRSESAGTALPGTAPEPRGA